MKKIVQIISVLAIVLLSSCSKEMPLVYSPTSLDIIPIPNTVLKVQDSLGVSQGFFEIDKETSILFDAQLSNSANFLSDFLSKGLGFQFIEKASKKAIVFSVNDTIVGDEAYRITISPQKLLIESKNDKGAFNAVQTLRQILPPSFENASYGKDKVKIDLLKIEDAPEYVYRGFMLDVARHFFTVDEVKRTIDLLAIYKINTLHLHLTDDQGWRIEIKSWPKLTEIGSTSSVKNEKTGFYTQDDYKEIQAYAKKHNIVVIPEIDMPGHTNAALASYAELNCDGKTTKLYKGTKVGFSSLCVDKDITYKFIDDVFGELAEITTGDYIHIGGDESHSTKKEDYKVFIKKAINIVKSKGKKVIGWDEIANADIDTATVVHYWGKVKNAKLAVTKGSKVIMSPSDKIYLDIKYNDSTKLGLTWAGRNPTDDAYDWNPETLVDGITRNDIFGIEAPLWSETVVKSADIEFLVFPRLPGVAEIAWSKTSDRNWETYKLRLKKQQERFEALGINYFKTPLVFDE